MSQAPAKPAVVDDADDDLVEIDLKDPRLAALLAWLWPGSGHLYQGRYAKGVIFMVSILSLFFFGLGISGGHAVYASFSSDDFRYSYLCQFPVGVPALPALLQNALVGKGLDPLLGGYMAPPRHVVGPEDPRPDDLSAWHKEYHNFLELGIAYTMIAGMLNVLAIFDAFAGPAFVVEESAAADNTPDDTAATDAGDAPADQAAADADAKADAPASGAG